MIAIEHDQEVQREGDDHDRDREIVMARLTKIASRKDHEVENLETTMNKLIGKHLKY